jgi:heptosyltransferase-3
MQKILVLRGGALGDLIVTLPALDLLRQRWPHARIELIGNPTAAALAVTAGLIDAAHSQHEATWGGLFNFVELPHELAAWLSTFDVVLNFWPDPDGELRRRFPLRPGQIFLEASALPQQAPAAAHYCEPLRTLGLEAKRFDYRFPAGRGEVKRDSRRVAVHPGSGSPRKNWPFDRWAEICRWLVQERRVELLVVLGEAEAGAALPAFGEVMRNRPLPELAHGLANCRWFLGHDSGVSHLAAAMGATCVLLFGPTDPAIWAPPGSNVEVIKHGAELSAISIAEVKEAATRSLESSLE